MSLPKAKKEKLVKEYQLHEKDTGSAEVQVALLSERIKDLTDHLKIQKKDHQLRNFISFREKYSDLGNSIH